MTDFDVCVLHQENKDGGWFSRSYYRFVVTELHASGKITYFYEGDWIVSKYSMSGAPNNEYYEQIKKNHQVFSNLIADGWKRVGVKGYQNDDEPLFRETACSSDKIIPISERIKVVNTIIQSGERNYAANPLLEALENIRDRVSPIGSISTGGEIADQIQARLEALDILYKVKKSITEEEYATKRQEILNLL